MKILLKAALGAVLGANTFAVSATKPVNLILINLDDSGYGDFSCNGAIGYETPNIDKMAAGGLRFTHFLVAQPISGASRAGLMTGCYPNRINFVGAPGPQSMTGIHEQETTMGEMLQSAGYRTAIFGKWHLGHHPQFLPLQNGFDEYYGLPYSNDMWPNHPNAKAGYPDLPLIEGNEAIGYNTDQSKLTTDYTEHAVDFIRRNRKNPFFVYLAHSMPHVPLAVSDKFKGKSRQGLYGDVMMELDWSVGEIMKTLEKYGLDENTLVVLTSDNGPWMNYGNHAGSTGGLREAKATTYEGGNRVACIMYWKGRILPGSICNSLVSSIDLFPTFAELGGAALPELAIDGVSLAPIVNGDVTAEPRKEFVYYFRSNDLQAVTDGYWKLVFPHTHRTYCNYPPGADGVPGQVENIAIQEKELYDLRRDPGERYNVIDRYPEHLDRLESIAARWRMILGDDLAGCKGTGRRPIGRVQKQ